MASKPKRIKTTETVVSILELLHEERQASLTEVAEHINLAKSTTHSHLRTLLDQELIHKTDAGYRLGLKSLDYGGGVRDQTDIYRAAKPQLQKLYIETGHTIHLAVREYNDLVLLKRINPDETAGFGAHVGQRTHFHTSALGKAILAYLSEEAVDSILSKHGLPQVSENSIADKAKLEAELETVRENEYAVNDEEEHRNYMGIARPVLVNNDVSGAISIAGPKSDLEKNRENVRDLLRSATDRIEIKLEYE